MKITEKLPQFENETALLVVTGKQDAVFYIAQNGEVNAVESFKVDKPKYTDLHGHFETRAHGKVTRAGSPYEPTDLSDDAVRQFLKELEEELKNVSRHYALDSLYIFYPSHMKNRISEVLPPKLARKQQIAIEGNFYEHHPFKLLERIQKKNSSGVIKPITATAQKILSKIKGTKK
ncbi:MAG: host attachment protein [Candidatus Paceibacterota bacterium]